MGHSCGDDEKIVDRGCLFMKRLEEAGEVIYMRESHRANIRAC